MKRLVLGCAFLIFLAISVPSSNAMVNADGIQWQVPPAGFITSVFQAVLGRAPTGQEMNAWLGTDLSTWKARMKAFKTIHGSNEYKARFGNLERKYDVWWNYRNWDDGQRKRMCRCYSMGQYIRGATPALQYTGVPYPAGRMTWPHARVIYLLCGLKDREVCPSADCGFQGNWGGSGGGPIQTGVNLIVQGNFAIFGQPGHGWGTGLYSQNGIWWNSGGARSFAQSIKLNQTPGAQNQLLTALYIRNNTGRASNVYGTTSQRINLQKGGTYKITLWASARNLASNGGVSIAIDPAWRVRPIILPAGTYGWQQFSQTFTAQDNYIDLRIISEDMGEVYLTGATLHATGAQVTQAATSSPCDSVCDQYCKSLAKSGGKLSPTGVCLMGTTSPGPAQACTCW